jgi:2,3-bisphosphoglycerate-dependent phosphoglycerate mutase
MPKSIGLYLVRHAESAANIDQSMNRHTADHKIPLSANGMKQAEKAGVALAAHFAADYDARESLPIHMWVSPYLRTVQTANIIQEEMMRVGIPVQVRQEAVLIEQQYGLFDGYADEELPSEFPREFADYNKWVSQQGRFYARMPNGESRFDVYTRLYQFLDAVHRKQDVGRHIVVSHGVTLRMLMMRWLGMSVDAADALKNPPNASVRRIASMVDLGYLFSGFAPDKTHRALTDKAHAASDGASNPKGNSLSAP